MILLLEILPIHIHILRWLVLRLSMSLSVSVILVFLPGQKDVLLVNELVFEILPDAFEDINCCTVISIFGPY